MVTQSASVGSVGPHQIRMSPGGTAQTRVPDGNGALSPPTPSTWKARPSSALLTRKCTPSSWTATVSVATVVPVAVHSTATSDGAAAAGDPLGVASGDGVVT